MSLDPELWEYWGKCEVLSLRDAAYVFNDVVPPPSSDEASMPARIENTMRTLKAMLPEQISRRDSRSPMEVLNGAPIKMVSVNIRDSVNRKEALACCNTLSKKPAAWFEESRTTDAIAVPLAPYLDPDHPDYAPELKFAVECWEALAGKDDPSKRKPWKDRVLKLIDEKLPNYETIRDSKNFRDRITTIVNPDRLKPGGPEKAS